MNGSNGFVDLVFVLFCFVIVMSAINVNPDWKPQKHCALGGCQNCGGEPNWIFHSWNVNFAYPFSMESSFQITSTSKLFVTFDMGIVFHINFIRIIHCEREHCGYTLHFWVQVLSVQDILKANSISKSFKIIAKDLSADSHASSIC